MLCKYNEHVNIMNIFLKNLKLNQLNHFELFNMYIGLILYI